MQGTGTTISCPKCKNDLAYTAGRYALMRFKGRTYLLCGVRLCVCERCGNAFSPAGLVTPQIAYNDATAAAGCVPFGCPTPDCPCRILGQSHPESGRVVLAYKHRLVVADRLVYASCGICGKDFHVETDDPLRTVQRLSTALVPVAPVATITTRFPAATGAV